MKLLVCGGDARQKYAARRLCEDGFDIEYALTAGADDDANTFTRKILDADAVLLPLPAFRAGRLNAPDASTQIDIPAAAEFFGGAKTLIGGILPPALLDSGRMRAVPVYDYYRDPDFTAANAVLTAEGVLGILIAETPGAVSGAEYLVTGYGSSARAIARLLTAAGARVTVAARRNEARSLAAAAGYSAVSFDALPALAPRFDAVINTVPAQVIGGGAIRALPEDALLLEIASAPFGIDFEAAARENRRVIKAPGLPGRFAAASAGRIIARCVKKYILSQKESGYE